MSAMTPEQFAERMAEIKLIGDVLRSLGYGHGVVVYESMVRWYA